MSSISELDNLKLMDDTLSQIEDQSAKDRILMWLWDKYGSSKSPLAIPKQGKTNQAKSNNKSKKSGNKTAPSIIKDLDLNPSGKKSFRSFAEEKNPSSQYEQCAVAVYYLNHELELDVTFNHVYTCFRDAAWRTPSNVYQKLVETASRKGWIDTSNMTKISVTPRGNNLVEHDLPKKHKK